MATSRPLRLVQQAAQPIEFCCPLCGSVHAAYIFGTGQFRIFRCAGCALTFGKNTARASEAPPSAPAGTVAAINRTERDYAGLMAAVDAARIDGPVLLVARPTDGLSELLRQRGLPIGITVGDNDFGPADWGNTYQAAIVSDALMRVADPRLALAKIRKHLAPRAPLLLSVPLLDGNQARLMGNGAR